MMPLRLQTAATLIPMVVALATVPGVLVHAQSPLPPPAAGQAAPVPSPVTPGTGVGREGLRAMQRDPATDARYKVRIMEGVLEKSVLQAALLMNQQLQTVSPELIQLTGAARARGYRLDGYGLFFDVEVPAAMRQTMGWTARVMRQRNETLQQALGSLKRLSDSLDGKARSDAELAVRQIELVVLPPPGLAGGPRIAAGTVGGSLSATSLQTAASLPSETPPVVSQPGTVAREPAPVAHPINPLILQNPDLAYELEVREALIGAMLEWGGLLPLTEGEWLTVAARDNQDVVIPGETADVVTIIMRVKAGDLAAYRAGSVTLAELRQRVEVREF